MWRSASHLLLPLLLAGCSSAPSTHLPPHESNTGTLDLVIAGLPSGTPGTPVRVRGPNFDKTFTQGENRIQLQSGTYNIDATEMPVDGVIYYPNTAHQSIEVVANVYRSASVLFNPIVVRVTPQTAAVEQDGTLTLSANVAGTTNDGVTWTVSGGSLNATGLNATWTAPSMGGTYTITASSTQEPARQAKTTVTVRHNKLHWARTVGTAFYEHGTGIGLDAQGHAYVSVSEVGGYENAIAIAKFASDGTHLWTRPFGPRADNKVLDLTTLPNGTTYVVGFTNGSFPGQPYPDHYDAYIAKLDSEGALLWARSISSPQTSTAAIMDIAHAVSVDAAGDVYIAGERGVSSEEQTGFGTRDAFVRKYTASGDLLWHLRFGGTGADRATGITPDGKGGAFVVGTTDTQLGTEVHAGGTDTFVTHVTAQGIRTWTRQFGGTGEDHAGGITTNNGAIYIGGYSTGGITAQSFFMGGKAFVGKLQLNGTTEWLRQQPGVNDRQIRRVVATESAVYAVGTLDDDSPYYEALLMRLDLQDGTWSSRAFGTQQDDEGLALTLDTSGNVWVAGTTEGVLDGFTNFPQDDVLIARFGP